MSGQQRVGAAADLPPGKVVGVGRYAVGNASGRYFASSAPKPATRQDLELVQGWLERAAVWLEAGQKKLPEAV